MNQSNSNIPVISVQDLAVSYTVRGGQVDAIHHVSFDIRRGESLGLVGESGCGKSTVAWSIVNFLGVNGHIRQGSIRFLGQDLVGRTDDELRTLRGNQIAMVYQDPMQALNPSMRIGDQLEEALTFHQAMSVQEARAVCSKMLDRVHMPDPGRILRCYPHQISGGQQQRVVIAMALLNNPSLLILDEPTTALDVTVEAAVLALLAELRESLDTAILFISHNLGVIARVCDRVGVMYVGEMVEQATTQDIFAKPMHPYTKGLMNCIPRREDRNSSHSIQPIPGQVPPPNARPSGCRFTPRCKYAQGVCSQESPATIAFGDHTVRCHLADQIAMPDEQAPINHARVDRKGESSIQIEVSDLKTFYTHQTGSLGDLLGFGEKRQIRALNGVSFGLVKGKTLGVVGESGCGKSTLVKTLIGLESSFSGWAKFLGFDLTQDLSKRSMELMRGLQMVFQNPDATLNPAYTVGHQIARVMLRFNLNPGNGIHTEVLRLLGAVRLDESYYHRYPRQLSGGERQRVGIARAFATHPDLVLCDEPVSALDVSVQAAILNLLLDIQKEYGTTMIFIAHDLSVVRYFSDYVAVMYLGEIVEFGPAEAIYAPPYHPYTEALLSAAPIPDPTVERKQIRLEGTVPSALDPPDGCPFHTRCPRKALLPDDGWICKTEKPPWRTIDADHSIYCHLPEQALAQLDPVIHHSSSSLSNE